ncbi:retrovirus-related pol polyprotein from transposon TNT 1-94 [Tanacetum coccineum]
MAIKEAKDLATLPLDELIGNLKVYGMVLDNDGVGSKTTKEKGNQFRRGNRFGNCANRFGRGSRNSFGNKSGESLKPKGACYNCGIEGHFASECRNPKENNDIVEGAWSDSEDDDEHQNDATCLMAIDSQEVVSKPSSSNNDLNIIDLQKENEELRKFNKDFAKTFKKLLNEKRSLENENSKLLSKINDLEFEVKKLAHNKEMIEPCENVCLKYDLLPDDWIVDSGYTKHMTENRRLFTSYKAYDGGHVIFGSNLNGKVVGRGNITHDSITITNVVHVSGLAFNLISVGDNSKQQICLTFVVDNSTLWHRRLGHANMRESSYEGNFYTLIIVDDHSNYTWVVFVESKDDVLDKFKILYKRLENLHDCSIVSVVTNHSSEFDKLQFGSFCKQHGISYNLSGPFTSQSSEIVEKTHLKLRKMSRAMLAEQSIQQKFWCHALDMATFIFNRVYTRKFINKTPYEILRNRKPSLEYFRVFGCKAFILNSKVHLTKFDPKSYEGVFLGYSQTSKAYIALNKETMIIEESLNVSFDECFPEPKSSPLVKDDRIIEPVVKNPVRSPSLEANASESGYPKSLKEVRGYPIKQVIGELNERTLRSKTKQA